MQRRTTTTRTTRPILILFLLLALIASVSTSGRAYAMPETTVTGYIWNDTDCDGIRQEGEPLHMGAAVYLFAAGEDSAINTADDQVIEPSGRGGALRYTFGITDLDYALVILQRDQPAGFFPGPLNAGADRSIDNDMRRDLWATNG